jgi:hypothetical protein
MIQKRQDILKELTFNMVHFLDLRDTFDVQVDELGLVMKGRTDPMVLSNKMKELVKNQGFTYSKGDTAEFVQKDVTMVGSVVVTRRFDRGDVVTLGVTV